MPHRLASIGRRLSRVAVVRSFWHRSWMVLAFVGAGLSPHVGWAAAPELTGVFPSGCQSGTTVTATLSGKELKDTQSLHFSVPGLHAKKVNDTTFEITADESAPAGPCELRVLTAGGLSAPRRFVITPLPQVIGSEAETTAEKPLPVAAPCVIVGQFESAADADDFTVELKAGEPILLLAEALSLDESIVPILTILGENGRELQHSPGHRQEPVRVFNPPSDGRFTIRIQERAYQKGTGSGYRLTVSSQPRLLAVFPSFVQRGKEAHVTLIGFRLPGGVATPIPDAPWILQKQVTLPPLTTPDPDGGAWLASSESSLEGVRYRAQDIAGSVRIGLLPAPVITEEEHPTDANGEVTVQKLPFPALVAGRFLTQNDFDRYRISAKKDQVLTIEVFGDRWGSEMMDSEISIHDSKGKLLKTLSDIAEPKGQPTEFSLASLDAGDQWKAPADGEYDIVVRDLFGGSVYGIDRPYLLSVGPVQPDFEVFAVPHNAKTPVGMSVPSNGHSHFDLVAVRRGMFTGPIHIGPLQASSKTAEGSLLNSAEVWIAESGLSGVGSMTSRSQEDRSTGNGIAELKLQAEADIAGERVIKEVLAAAIVRGGNPLVSRRTDRLVVGLLPPEPIRVDVTADTVAIQPGSWLRAEVTVTTSDQAALHDDAKLAWTGLPAKSKPDAITLPKDAPTTLASITLAADTKPGWQTVYGTVQAQVIKTPPSVDPNSVEQPDGKDKGEVPKKSDSKKDGPKKAEPPKPKPVEVVTNAFSFEIAPATAKVAVKQPKITVAAGGTFDIPFDVVRDKSFTGEVRVSLDLPDGETGFSCSPVTVPADAKTGVLKVTATESAAIGQHKFVAVAATAELEGRPVVFRSVLDLTVKSP